jgi:hypothetical protein
VKQAIERDRGLLSLVERIMKRPADPEPAASDIDGSDIGGSNVDSPDNAANPAVADAPPLPSLEPQLSIESTHVVSRKEMAEMILRALATAPDCPKQGFEVTIYGVRPWNAMLRITPAAGPVRDSAAWRDRVREMIPRLRDQYELSD